LGFFSFCHLFFSKETIFHTVTTRLSWLTVPGQSRTSAEPRRSQASQIMGINDLPPTVDKFSCGFFKQKTIWINMVVLMFLILVKGQDVM